MITPRSAPVALLLHGALLIAALNAAAAPDRLPDEIGANHKAWFREVEGPIPVSQQRARLMEIATGMNYWDGDRWVPSEAAFEVTPDAFVANRVQHLVSLNDDLNRLGAVTVVTRDGVVLDSTPVAIGLYDAATGDSMIIAGIQNSRGVLVKPNKVLYQNAFRGLNGEGICADVMYTVNRASFEQDVIITGRIDPEAYGFPKATTQLQIYTEFYDAPRPERVRRPIRVENREDVRRRMATPDFVDEVLGFGEFVLATGRAFASDANPTRAAVPVAKEFVTKAGRTFLVESVEYTSVQKDFEALPPCNPRRAAMNQGRRALGKVNYATIPAANPHKGNAGLSKVDVERLAKVDTTVRPGVVIDYIADIGTTISGSVTFKGDTTYFVSGPVVCNGPATIEGGAVFKFKHPTTAPVGAVSIKINNTLACKTSSHRPAVFTAVDDDSIGDSLNGHPGSGYQQPIRTDGYANPAVWINNLSSQQLSNLRFSYCQEAIKVEGGSGNTLSHAQLVKCIRGVVITGSGGGCGSGCSVPITVNNALFANVSVPVTISRADSTAKFCHTTVQSTPAVATLVTATATSACNFHNSVLANITAVSSGSVTVGGDFNGFHGAPQFGASPVISSTSPFQVAGAGSYYLAEPSPFRNAGSTAALATTLPGELKLRTTYPPIVAPAQVGDATWSVQAPRDTDALDLGYHYDPIDYVANGVNVQGGELKVEAGTVVAVYGNQSSYGIQIGEGGRMVTRGTPQNLCRFVHYKMVQEQLNNPWLPDGVLTTIFTPVTTTVHPAANFRFTHFGMHPSGAELLWMQGPFSAPMGFFGCFFEVNAVLVAANASAAFTNCVFDRTAGNYGGNSCEFRNNLFVGGSFHVASPGTPYAIHNNIFDRTAIAGNSSAHTHNGFVTDGPGQTLTPAVGDVSVSSLIYETGVLGHFYQPTTSPFLNNGSTSANSAGLAHYTVLTSQAKDTGNVDRGFHYVAIANGQPVDTDGDGVPDYLEDTNGDNDFDAGETNHQLRDDAADYDGDGLSNLEEQQLGFDPLAPPLTVGRKLWLRAHGSVSTASGAVTEWRDDSGNGNHLSQSQASARPTLVASVQNGKPAVQFDGNDDVLKALGQVSMSGRLSASWLAVVRPTAGTFGQILENRQIFMKWFSAESFLAALHRNGSWDPGGILPITPADYSVNQTYVVLCTYDSVAARQRIYVNGSLAVDMPATGAITSESGTPDLLALRIGATAWGDDSFNGYVMEAMIYGHALSVEERDLMHRYLQQKYGLSLHPIPKTGQKLWLRADAGVTRDVNNVAVNRWIDQSGEGNDVLQTSGTAAQPSFVYSGINSKPAVRFASDDFLKAAGQVSLNGKMSGTWLAVVRHTGTGIGQILENRQIYMAASSGEALFGVDVHGTTAWVHGGGGPYTASGDYPYNNTYVVMAIYDHAAARHRIFVNGALAQEWPSKGAIGTEPGHPADNLKLRVGVGLNPANFAHFNGDIAEVMIYDHALTLSERTAIEGYLGQKYGVSLLPPIPTTGQKLWLHANAGVLRDANNISVTNWLDQSPSRNHALQPPGTTLHPSYVLNALNGKPVIRFDGVNDYLKCLIQADLGAKTSGSWLAVVKPTGGGVSQILENRQIDMAWRGGEQVFAADVFRIPGWVDPGNGPLTPGGYGPDSPYAILCIYDGVLGKHRIYVNGTLVTETPASPAAISSASAVAEERKLKIGSFFNGTSYSLPFTGDITEVLIYDRGLTAAERQTIDQYLASKYGTLDLDFDEDHVIDSQDIDPNDPSLGRLTITIEQPANGSTIN